MARDDLTEIAIVMDESGSMATTADDAIGGFNSFLESQRTVEGDSNVTLILFDDKYEVIYDGMSLEKVPDLTKETYHPGGGTALIDALGKTIDSLSTRIFALPEEDRPGKVIVIVITDGQENSSHEYKRSDITSKIKDLKTRCGWELVFIGASDAILEQADGIGFDKKKMMRYKASKGGTMRAFSAMSDVVCSYRSTGSYELPDDAEGPDKDPMWKKKVDEEDDE